MALPLQFIDNIKHLATLEPRVNGLLEALTTTTPSVSVRFNRAKATDHPDTIAGEPLGSPVPWCPNGYYLNNRPLFILDPAIHQGRYYVQDASSMFISHVINSLTADSHIPLVYLDACASPGGKTTAAIDSLPDGSLVVANEWDYRRAEILRENITKWGYPGTIVTRGDTRQYRKLRSTFDIIAADVPCSGEGMMRKDSEAVNQWTPSLIAQCADRQREIIENLWPALKPGGYLIYSTCTFNRTENEEIINYLIDTLGAIPVTIPLSDDIDGILPGIDTTHPCYRFMPHRVDGEGLFMAVVQKTGDMNPGHSDKSRGPRPAKLPFKLPHWIPSTLHPILAGDTLYGIPTPWKSLIDRLIQTLDVIQPGTELAIVKGRDLIPSQGLAMSTQLDTDNCEHIGIDLDTALSYLRRDTVTLPPDTPRGHILLTYAAHPLGWIKNIGSRANNLYPAQWRILRH